MTNQANGSREALQKQFEQDCETILRLAGFSTNKTIDGNYNDPHMVTHWDMWQAGYSAALETRAAESVGDAERELLSVALSNCQIALVKSEQDATERWREGVQYIANKICGEIPDGYVITLEMENGSASVSLFDWQNEENIELPEQDEPYVCKWLTEALDAAKAKHDGGVFVQACRPEDRAMLATPAGQELVAAVRKSVADKGADVGVDELPREVLDKEHWQRTEYKPLLSALGGSQRALVVTDINHRCSWDTFDDGHGVVSFLQNGAAGSHLKISILEQSKAHAGKRGHRKETMFTLYPAAIDLLRRFLNTTPPEPAQRCQCSLRTKLVGDGCDICNPELAQELAAEDEPAQQVVP
jgi:hypothetical protein